MKILYIQDTDWIRRNPIQHNHLAERMVLRGHNIRVIDYEILWREEVERKLLSKKKRYKVARLFKNAFHEVIRPPIIKFPLLDYFSMLITYTKEIKYQLRVFKPDVIILDGILSPYLAIRAAKRFKIKTIYYCIDVNYKLIPYKILQPFGKILERINMKKVDLVLSINEVLREYTINMGVIAKNSKVIRAGVDFKRFNSNIDGKKIRDKYTIKDTDTLVIFIGWLYHFSGLKEVIRGINNFREKAIKLIIVGDGDAYQDIDLLRKKLDLEDKIIMVGRKPYERIPKFLAAADICILPAYNNEIMRYIVPIKIYEYMAMQKPVLCTKLPGIYKEFGTGNGIIYIKKPEDTISCIINLVNEGIIGEEGNKARSFVKNKSWKKVVSSFENILNSI